MAFEVNPDSLRSAAGAVAMVPAEVDRAPYLGAAPNVGKLRGSVIGGALNQSDPASKRAKDVVKARFNQFSSVLAISAETFRDTDLDAAARIAAIGDINSGDPHAGR
ncbi:hypothetical protein [Nocardia sp. NPDC058666]|uniref:hypothetical protein n=1 Tax=unclassified Nocardia TaxID=2637762 RepID=UPI00364EF9C0